MSPQFMADLPPLQSPGVLGPFDIERTPGEEDPEALRSREIMEQYDTAQRKEWITAILEDDLFRNSIQWFYDEVKQMRLLGMFPAIMNKIHGAVEQAKALLTYNTPRFNATAQEDSDTDTASVISSVMTWIWNTSRGNSLLKRIIDDYIVRSVGYCHITVDPAGDFGLPHVKLEKVNPVNVYVSSTADDPLFDTSPHIIIREIKSAQQIRFEYPQYASLLPRAIKSNVIRTTYPAMQGVHLTSNILDIQTLDPKEDHYEILCRYTKERVLTYRITDTTTGEIHILDANKRRAFLKRIGVIVQSAGTETVITDEQRTQEMMQMMSEGATDTFHAAPGLGEQPDIVPGPEMSDPEALPGTEQRWVLVRFDELLRMGVLTETNYNKESVRKVFSIGGRVAYNETLPLTIIPVVPIINGHNGNPWGTSDVRKARPVQEELNKVHQIILTHAANSANVKVLYPSGAVDHDELSAQLKQVGTTAIPYVSDGSERGGIVVVAPTPLPPGIMLLEDRLDRHIQELFGIFSLMQGDTSDAPNTYRGTMAIEEFGQRRIRSKQMDVENFLNRVGKVVLEFIPHVYTEERVIRLVNPDNTETKFTVNQPVFDVISGYVFKHINDVTVGAYDIVVVSGSMLPSNRWAMFQAYLDMYDRGIVDQQTVLLSSEIPHAQNILQRFGAMRQMQQQIQAMDAEIKKLEGDLQTATRESMHDKKRAALSEFKLRLERAQKDTTELASVIEELVLDQMPGFTGSNSQPSIGQSAGSEE